MTIKNTGEPETKLTGVEQNSLERNHKMKTTFKRGLGSLGLTLALFLVVSCEKTVTGHEDNFLVILTVLQNNNEVDTVAVNVPADLVFEVTTDDDHGDNDHSQGDPVSDLHMTIGIGLSGDNDDEHGSTIDAHESDQEPGHYEVTHTFDQTGTYEVHCSFDHDDDMFEEHFDLVVE